MFVAVAVQYPSLPDPMPTHWNAAGHVTAGCRSSGARTYFPLRWRVIWLVFLVLPKISPRGFEMEPFLRAWGVLKVTILAVMALHRRARAARGATCGGELSPTAIFVALGVLFVVIGNLLGKVTRNFFVGIRTPWTLASEEVWLSHAPSRREALRRRGTLHRGGVARGASGLARLVASVAVASVVPIVYSYVIYRRLEGVPGRTT